MKTLTTLVLIGIQAALPCAAIAETWADDVRSAYDASARTAPGMEIAMLTPEEAQHIRAIVAEESQSAVRDALVLRTSSDAASGLLAGDVLSAPEIARSLVPQGGYEGSFWGSWKGVTVVVVAVIAVAAVAYVVVKYTNNNDNDTNITVTGDNNRVGGAGDQSGNNDAAEEAEASSGIALRF